MSRGWGQFFRASNVPSVRAAAVECTNITIYRATSFPEQVRRTTGKIFTLNKGNSSWNPVSPETIPSPCPWTSGMQNILIRFQWTIESDYIRLKFPPVAIFLLPAAYQKSSLILSSCKGEGCVFDLATIKQSRRTLHIISARCWF